MPDWLATPDLERLWAGLSRALATGGRVVMRSAFRAAPAPSGPAAALLAIDATASAELTATERTGLFAAVTLLRRVRLPGTGDA